MEGESRRRTWRRLSVMGLIGGSASGGGSRVIRGLVLSEPVETCEIKIIVKNL